MEKMKTEIEVVKLPVTNELGFYEIRMESIGGFGANLAGKILGEAGILLMGYNGSNFSSYGSEKKGSPVRSFVRFCDPDVLVRTNSPVTEPHMLAIFHEEMVKSNPVTQGVGVNTTIVMATSKSPAEARDFLKLQGGTMHCVDAMKIAVEEKTRVNTALLGAMCKASGFINPDAIKEMISKNLGKKYAFLIDANLKTFDRGFAEGVSEHFDDGKYPFVPFKRKGQELGYLNQTIGGTLTTPATTIHKDLSSTRMGWIPVLHLSKCTSCGECDITCPDYCFVWENGVDKKGKEVRLLKSIAYHHCKGCLRCVNICKFDALESCKEYEVDPKIIEKGFSE